MYSINESASQVTESKKDKGYIYKPPMRIAEKKLAGSTQMFYFSVPTTVFDPQPLNMFHVVPLRHQTYHI